MFSPPHTHLPAALRKHVLFASAFCATAIAQAKPLAYDRFEYETPRLASQGGGEGWAAPWSGKSATISDESLSYLEGSLKRGGGRSIKVATNNDNALSRDVLAATDQSGADYYVSFIFQVKSQSKTGLISGEIFSGWQCMDDHPNAKVANIGLTGFHGRAAARVNSASKQISTPLEFGTTYFLVIKYGDWNGSSYLSTTVWLNPTRDSQEASSKVRVSSTVGAKGFRGIRVRTFGLAPDTYYLFDDVCVGRSWEDVTVDSLPDAH